jgi:branched-chain amino acid aminotransferase
MSFISYNGVLLPSEQPGLSAGNRSYKWGDGVFETIKVYKGRLLLPAIHFDRLFLSLQLLEIKPTFNRPELEGQILALCEKNGCTDVARVRLAVYRNHENQAGYTIEAIELPENVMQWNETGLRIDTFPHARKACDVWANLKTANYLPYVMAGRYAEEKGLQECLVLNCYNYICDASKANIFIIKNKIFYTPGLDQGCVNGVSRRFILQKLKEQGGTVMQTELTEEMLLDADECFLTNAIQGIRWVGAYRQRQYKATLTKQLYDTVFASKNY